MQGAEAFSGLHVLADDDPRWTLDPVDQARAACEGGARVVQLRAKHATDRRILEWARAIRQLTRKAGVAFVVNDRADLALLTEADGVHLGQSDMAPEAVVRAIAGSTHGRLAIGRSTHTLEQARAANDEPVDYVAFGPVFGTTSKDSAYSQRGLEALGEVARTVAPRPVVGIGGIETSNAAHVRETGARGIAVISAVAAADDPVAAAGELTAAFCTRPRSRPGVG